MSDIKHKTIYLQPECCADPDVGQLWCEDNMPGECGLNCEPRKSWEKYVLASEAEKEIAALKQQVEERGNLLWDGFYHSALGWGCDSDKAKGFADKRMCDECLT